MGSAAKLSVGETGTYDLTGRGTVDVADGACATVSVSRAGTAFDGRLGFSGTGRAVVTGAEPDFAFADGDVVTMQADGHDTRTVSRSAGEAGTLTIAATNSFRLSRIPEGVKTCTVSGAREVVLAAPRETQPDLPSASTYEVAIPNANFETTWAKWTLTFDAAYQGKGASYNFLDHTTTSWWMADQSRTHAGLEGRYCLAMKMDSRAEVPITIPLKGRYEFSCLVSSRTIEYSAGVVDVQIIRNSTTTTVGRLYGDYPCVSDRQRIRTPELAAGDCRLVLLLDGAISNGKDVHVFVDDIRMHYLPETDGTTVFAVPNGDFEFLSNYPDVTATTLAADEKSFTNANEKVLVPQGWTLEGTTCTETGVTPQQKLCGAFTKGMTGFVNRREMNYGSVQMMMSGSAAKITSSAFTPPAGTWKLRLRAGALKGDSNNPWQAYKSPQNSSDANPVLSASVSIDGAAATELGVTPELAVVFDDLTFDTPFTVDGSQTVSVSVRQTRANTAYDSSKPTATLYVYRALVDDLELVKVDEPGELVTNGSFEAGQGWTLESNKDVGGSYSDAACVTIGPASPYYGYETCDGTRHLRLDQVGRAHQQVTFPEAGTYRLSFWTRARPDDVTGAFGATHKYSGNRIHAYLTDGESRTIDILTTDPVWTWSYVENQALFAVPAAGTYELSLAGTHQGPDPVPGGGANTAADCHAFVDLVSIQKASAPVAGVSVPETLRLDVRDGATLRLDYDGQLTLTGVRVGGRRRFGVISAARFPGVVSGPGSIYVEPKGFQVIVR